jgi:hypothetical protein
LAAGRHDPLNDAALSILDTLGKQRPVAANDVLKEALKSNDLLIRRRAASLLKANGAGEFLCTNRNGANPQHGCDYKRALARIGKKRPGSRDYQQGFVYY